MQVRIVANVRNLNYASRLGYYVDLRNLEKCIEEFVDNYEFDKSNFGSKKWLAKHSVILTNIIGDKKCFGAASYNDSSYCLNVGFCVDEDMKDFFRIDFKK